MSVQGLTARVIRGADDLHVRVFEPSTTTATVMLSTCSYHGVSVSDVIEALASSDSGVGVRIMQGRTAERWTGSTWAPLDPVLEFGPMLVRTLHVTEHPETRGTWVCTYEATGMGAPLAADGTPLAEPSITVNVASRPRTANAYRVDDPTNTTPLVLPEDVELGTTPETFGPAPWNDGVDIGGRKVDVNTSPLGVAIDQSVVTITWIARFPYLTWAGTYENAPRNLTASNEYIGGRNRCEFLQFPVGTLLCETVDIQPLHHEFKLVTFVATYDAWKHAQQVPLTNPQFFTPTTLDPVTAMSQTHTVLWQQPYLDTWCLDSTVLSQRELDFLDAFEALQPGPSP
jgi:hypothetical protein